MGAGYSFSRAGRVVAHRLHAINKIPGRGARVLEEAIQSGRIKSDTKINNRLFRLWMQAGERDKATIALEKAALNGSGYRTAVTPRATVYGKRTMAGNADDGAESV